MKKILILFTLLLPLSISAQTCEQMLSDAQNAAKKGFYKDAVLKYLAAQKVCPTTRDQEIKGYIVDVFTKIDALKSKAEKAEKDVKDALKQAETNLQQAKAANERVVAAYIRDIEQHILKLEYDNAFEKCQIALALNIENKKADIAKYVLEIAYFYTETDTFQAAIKTLDLLNINPLSNRADLLAAIQKNAPPQYFQVLEERYYPKMITVEGGRFKGEYDVIVKVDGFKMAETETTVWQYFLYLRAKRQKPRDTPAWKYEGNNPMIYMTWYDAIEYCNWVSERQKRALVYDIDKNTLDTVTNLNDSDDVKWTIKTQQEAKCYRLPTEAEWEYAARGGSYQSPYEYSGSDNIDEVAWYTKNSSSRTQPVKRLKPNALGLYDMSGNVSEWCFDWYAEKYNFSSKINPRGAEKEAIHVVRGGSWGGSNLWCSVSDHDEDFPDFSYYSYGFRCVRND